MRLGLVVVQVFVARAAPANWTAVVGLDVNRNAAFNQPQRLGQSDSAVDLVAVFVLCDGRSAVEVFGAKTFIAMPFRVHSFAFAISLTLKLARCELVDVIIWKRYETLMKYYFSHIYDGNFTANCVHRTATLVVVLLQALLHSLVAWRIHGALETRAENL